MFYIMNRECKSAGLIFGLLSLYSYNSNAPDSITYGSLLCSVTGILCHHYGFRKLDLITTTTVICINIYYAYINKYLNYNSFVFALFGAIMYLKKTKNHIMFVQLPFFISIVLIINQYKSNSLSADIKN